MDSLNITIDNCLSGAASLGSPVLKIMPMKKHIIKYIIFVIGVFIVGYMAVKQNISPETLLAFTPRNQIMTAGILLLLYAAKSATIVFPLIALEIAVGHLFEPWTALGINFLGILIVLTIPYCIGQKMGLTTVEKLAQKYPRLEEIIEKQKKLLVPLLFSQNHQLSARRYRYHVSWGHQNVFLAEYAWRNAGHSSGNGFSNTNGKQHSRSSITSLLVVSNPDDCAFRIIIFLVLYIP